MDSSVIKQWVFIGGTGRSGTTVLAKTLSSHSQAVNWWETRWMIDPHGSCDYLEGKCNAAQHKIALTRYFQSYRYQLRFKAKKSKPLLDYGYHETEIPWEVLDDIFRDGDRDAEVGRFVRWFFEPTMKNLGKSIVVEKTPPLIMNVATMRRIFPDAYFIHSIRDPRDVARSIVTRSWGPRSPYGCTIYIKKVLEQALKAKSGKYLVTSVERMAENKPAEFERICNFLSWPMDQINIDIFKPENAHIGSWPEQFEERIGNSIQTSCREMYEAWQELIQ